MKQDNSTIRDKAIGWWDKLPFNESLGLMFKFYPTREDYDKLEYLDKVEIIYLSEHPEQAAKEESQDNSKEGDWFFNNIDGDNCSSI